MFGVIRQITKMGKTILTNTNVDPRTAEHRASANCELAEVVFVRNREELLHNSEVERAYLGL